MGWKSKFHVTKWDKGVCPQIARIFEDLVGGERGLEEKQTADDLVEYRILISVHECSLAVQPKLVDRISYRSVGFFNKFVE
jgi:hypothetical protein